MLRPRSILAILIAPIVGAITFKLLVMTAMIEMMARYHPGFVESMRQAGYLDVLGSLLVNVLEMPLQIIAAYANMALFGVPYYFCLRAYGLDRWYGVLAGGVAVPWATLAVLHIAFARPVAHYQALAVDFYVPYLAAGLTTAVAFWLICPRPLAPAPAET